MIVGASFIVSAPGSASILMNAANDGFSKVAATAYGTTLKVFGGALALTAVSAMAPLAVGGAAAAGAVKGGVAGAGKGVKGATRAAVGATKGATKGAARAAARLPSQAQQADRAVRMASEGVGRMAQGDIIAGATRATGGATAGAATATATAGDLAGTVHPRTGERLGRASAQLFRSAGRMEQADQTAIDGLAGGVSRRSSRSLLDQRERQLGQAIGTGNLTQIAAVAGQVSAQAEKVAQESGRRDEQIGAQRVGHEAGGLQALARGDRTEQIRVSDNLGRTGQESIAVASEYLRRDQVGAAAQQYFAAGNAYAGAAELAALAGDDERARPLAQRGREAMDMALNNYREDGLQHHLGTALVAAGTMDRMSQYLGDTPMYTDRLQRDMQGAKLTDHKREQAEAVAAVVQAVNTGQSVTEGHVQVLREHKLDIMANMVQEAGADVTITHVEQAIAAEGIGSDFRSNSGRRRVHYVKAPGSSGGIVRFGNSDGAGDGGSVSFERDSDA